MDNNSVYLRPKHYNFSLASSDSTTNWGGWNRASLGEDGTLRLNINLHYFGGTNHCLLFFNCLQDSMPLSTLVMGDPSNTAPSSLAQRLGNDVRRGDRLCAGDTYL